LIPVVAELDKMLRGQKTKQNFNSCNKLEYIDIGHIGCKILNQTFYLYISFLFGDDLDFLFGSIWAPTCTGLAARSRHLDDDVLRYVCSASRS
jgi:hypothetical protein